MTCAVCGRTLPEDARFCPNCGALVSTSLGTEERKVVTVLFADLVDSTGLAQRLDAERAREVLGRFYAAATEELQALRGQVEKFIGDAVMAVFGLPQVHEDDAVRAVRAGLAIRDRIGRLSQELGLDEPLTIRVGIESGEAATGVGPSGQMLVTGSVVNAAARLQTAAAPGEVLVGATVHALTQESVSYGEKRDVQAKGFEIALDAYPAHALSTRSVRRTIPFVGRANELTILRDGFSRVSASGRPLLITVLGESGIGKSRLADEFVAGIGTDGTALLGRSHLATDSATFAPVATMVRDAAGIDDAHEAERILERLRTLVERWPADDDSVERTVERLALVLGISEGRHEESAFVQDVRAGFLRLVEGLAAEGPVALVFDDAHTLRPPMLDLIERLGARARRGPGRVLILATGRPQLLEQRPSWGSGAVNHMLLRLDPLSEPDAVELARQSSGGRLDEQEARGVAIRTGGNPFFIVESTGVLLMGGDGAPLASGRVPPTVQAVVASRLDSLPPLQRDLTRRLSVYTDWFDLEGAGLVAPCSVEELHVLEDAEIVVRDESGPPTPGPASRWRLRHETLRDVAYASLPKRQRLELHLAIAESLLATGHVSYAAEHLECAAQASKDIAPGDTELPERAAATLAAAGDRARRRMENRSALDYYERSLAMSGAEEGWGVREARVLAGAGESRYWLGEYPAATELLERAVALGTELEDEWTLALAFRFLGDIAINVEANVDRAEELLARSLRAAEGIDEPFAVSRTLLFAGWVPWTRERYEDAEPIWERALALAREHDDRWAEVRALTSLSINHAHMDQYEEATRLIEEAQTVAEAMDDQFSMAVATVQRGRLFGDRGQFEESIAYFDAAIAIFADLGARWELADATAERGISNRELGRLDEAEEDLRQAVRISEELGERQLAGWTWRALARVAEKRGDQVEAEARFRRAEEEDVRRPK
jgi:class 3 adenylate cyclase/tetratricopeptide (TPR) repeat protein